jgi:hypothetical protein
MSAVPPRAPSAAGGSPLLDAQQASALLNVPASWLLAQARADRVPHMRLGRYVRFDGEELLHWVRNGQHRGPRS